MKKFLFAIPIFSSGLAVAFAQNRPDPSQLYQLLALAQAVIDRLGPLLVGVALLAFFWSLVKFIWKGNENPATRSAALKGMWYSLIALFVMVCIWGIIGTAQNILGVTPATQPTVHLLPPSLR